jgi:OFA family oxalate/formate antiporter-like MFS transporter
MAAHAARSLSGIGRDARGRDCRAPDNAQLLTARDAAKPGLLFAVSDDEHDVDQRADLVVSNVGPFAKEFGVADMLVLGMAALPLSLTLSRVTNGLTRPFFGWISDHIGREPTMALAFSLEAIAILVLFAFINQPALFVVLTGLVFFGWGEIFSLFPSTLTDTFGPKYAATNYGFLYIAQGVGSILGGPAAAFLEQTTGSWTAVFIVVAARDALTALLAIAALQPMRRGHIGNI